MHKSFYKLDCEPFDLQPDPMFLWMGEKYKEALSVLRYGILDNKGFLLLTGEAGVGKTTLLRALTESLPADVLWAIIPNPGAPKMEMFNIIGKGFGMDKEYTSKVEFMLDFGTFLQERHEQGKKMLLIVDSAHLLGQENLEELRLLSNIEHADTKLIHIFFSAQPSFGAILTRPRNSAIRQRLSLTHSIEPLTAQETTEYIEHRFSVAGVENRILTEKAIRSVHHFSGGIPKKINVICQQVLIEGAKQGRRVIDQGAVQECMQKFARSTDPNRMDFAAGSMRGSAGEERSSRARTLLMTVVALALLAAIAVGGYFAWSQWRRAANSSARPAAVDVPAAPSRTQSPDVGKKATPPAPVIDSTADNNAPPQPRSSLNDQQVTDDSPASMINRIAARPVAPPAPKIGEAPDTASSQETAAPTVTISPVTGLATVHSADGAAAAQKTPQARLPDGQAAPSTKAAVTSSPEPDRGGTETVGEQRPLGDDGEQIIIDPRQDTAPEENPTPVAPPPQTSATAPQAVERALPQLKAALPLRANSLALTNSGDAALTNFVRKFKAAGRGRIEVRGYVSSSRDSGENTRLSMRRAEAVRAMLLGAGVDEAAIVVRGMGVQDPLGDNSTPEGRDKNRRVELEIIP
ncbi:MAG: AAA family ATPase [Desulfobulbaceae bacterium]|jgi:type II secretory pathway predicted ATPase ExeA/outer membrane protein OmpA-like peptidoglycan-associated protein|nr:AAA family ATPase [Desulfobulbaceae bacterium]